MRVSTHQNEFSTQKQMQSKKLGHSNKSGPVEQKKSNSNQQYLNQHNANKLSIGSGSASNSFLQDFVQKQSKQPSRQLPSNGGNNGSSMLFQSPQFEEEKGQGELNEDSFRMQLENNSLSRIEGRSQNRQASYQGQAQLQMMQGGQGQGQGYQEKTAITEPTNVQTNQAVPQLETGVTPFLDEASVLEIIDKTLSDEMAAPVLQSSTTQLSQQEKHSPFSAEAQLLNQPSVQNTKSAIRNNEQTQAALDYESNALKQALLQIAKASQSNHAVQQLVQSALGHQKKIDETLAAQNTRETKWRHAFKQSVRNKVHSFKANCQNELKKAEDDKYKYQVAEFDLNQRVSHLEEAYAQQQDEITKQANANEQLKFEKMTLIREHGKRMSAIEKALGQIQIQKVGNSSSINDHVQKQYPSKPHNRGYSHSGAVFGLQKLNNDHLHDSQELKKQSTIAERPDLEKKQSDELSKSFCIGEHARASQSMQRNQPANQEAKGEASRQGTSIHSQLNHLHEMIKQFKRLSDEQRQNEVKKNQYQMSLNDNSGDNPQHVASISDIEFNPDQKLTNDFLKSQSLLHASDGNSKSRSKSNDVNQAFIDGGENDETESNVNSFCGELAQQLNNTSAFGLDHDTSGVMANEQDPKMLNVPATGFGGNANSPSISKEEQIELDQMEQALNGNDNVFGPSTNVDDSVDKEVQELFANPAGSQQDSDSLTRDIQGGKELGAFQKKHQAQTRNKGAEATDVDLEELMKVSMATDFNPANPSDPPNLQVAKRQEDVSQEKTLSSFDIQQTDTKAKKKHTNQQFSLDLDSGSNLGLVDSQPMGKIFKDRGLNLSNINASDEDIQILGALPSTSKDPNHHAVSPSGVGLGLNLPDLSCIEAETSLEQQQNAALDVLNVIEQHCSDQPVGNQIHQQDYSRSEEKSFAALHRNLMPTFTVQVGEKEVKMPLLDIERVVQLEGREEYKKNPNVDAQSLVSDPFLKSTFKEKEGEIEGHFVSKTSGASFLNDSCSKQIVSVTEGDELKPRQTQSDAININDNQCDQPIASVLNVTPFEEEESKCKKELIQQADPLKPRLKPDSREEISLSLLEESIEVEDVFDNGNINMLDSLREQIKKEDEQRQLVGEERDQNQRSPSEFNMPFEIGPRDSQNTGLRSSGLVNVSNRQQKERRTRPSGASIVIDDGTGDEYKGAKSQMPVAKRESLFAHEHIEGVKLNDLSMSQKELPKKSEMMVLADLENSGDYEEKAATNNLASGNVMLRGRAPSDSKTGDSDSNADGRAMVSPTTVTNGTESQTGSLVPSILGNKTRLSAPVTFPSKTATHAPQPNTKARESYVTADVVNEVEDEDSKVCSNAGSQSRISSAQASGQETGSITSQLFIYNSAYPKTTKHVAKGKRQKVSTSISRIKHSDMSTLIKHQQKSSSSIQRLKIVKKASVQSAAQSRGDDGSSIGKNQRDVASVSVGRPSAGGISSVSVLEQSKTNVARVGGAHVSHEYATNPNYGANDSRLQIEGQPSASSKPSTQFRISLKNIEMVGRQNRQVGEKGESQKREDSEKRASVIRLMKNLKNQQASGVTNTGDLSLANVNASILRKQQQSSAKQKNPNITVLHKKQVRTELKDDERLFMQQIAKINNSTVAGRLSTATNGSVAVSATNTEQDAAEAAGDKRSSSKGTRAKLLIDAKAVRQRKLSIGSNRTGDGNSKSHVRRNSIKVVSPMLKPGEEGRSSTVESRQGAEEVEGSGEAKRRRNASKPGKITLNKANIRLLVADRRGSNAGVAVAAEAVRQKSKSLKRRQTPTGEKNADNSHGQGAAAKVAVAQPNRKSGAGIRAPSSGGNPDPKLTPQSHYSGQQDEQQPLKIKRISRSKKRTQGRPSTASGTGSAIRISDSQITVANQSCINNITASTELKKRNDTSYASQNSNIPSREIQPATSNTVLNDISILSKIGEKNQVVVMAPAQQFTQQQQSVAQGKDQQRPSISGSGLAQVQAMHNSSVDQGQPQAAEQHSQLQLSQKALKLISSQKCKNNGAQRQVQKEWKQDQ